jgi:lysophospholipase L1-like esterase
MSRPRRGLAVRAAAVLVLAGAFVEGLARFASPPLSPPDYLEAEPDDERFHCCVGPHPHLPGHPPATRFDRHLIWTLDPRLPGQALNLPSRREIISEHSPHERVVVALGDGFTAGPLAPRLGWPDMLQELVDMNRPRDGLRVVNAAVPGYSSLQGLLSYRPMEDLRADVLVLGFGGDDARRVRHADARWLERIRRAEAWGPSRALTTLLRWAWSLRPAPAPTHRVPLDDYTAHLRELLRLARARGAQPVLLTRPYRGGQPLPENLAALPRYNAAARAVAATTGITCLDLHAELGGDARLFADTTRPSPAGLRRVAETVLRHLRSRGLVETDHRFSAGGRVADWSDFRPELRSGFWPAERWPGGDSGRWTAAQARLALERRGEEGGLLVDLTLHDAAGRKSCRIEAGGRTLLRFAGRDRRLVRILDVRGIEGPVIELRLVTEGALPPPDSRDAGDDRRLLGVFVHRVELVPAHLATDVDLASADDDRPELGAGWRGMETWPDGRRGRWTGARAELRLGRPPGHDLLVVDLSLESPRGRTEGYLEVDGRRLAGFEGSNGPRQLRIDLRGMAPRGEVHVSIGVTRTFRPRSEAKDSPDVRELGVFVHQARLLPG